MADDGMVLLRLGNSNTVRAYAAGVGRTTPPLAVVVDDEIGDALETLWDGAAVNTWNTRRAAMLSWLAWFRKRGQVAPAVPAWAKRLAAPDSRTPPTPGPRSTG
ncbi:hypothetical protein ACWEPL_10405 [Nonomuraea sp. NPDC004186]